MTFLNFDKGVSSIFFRLLFLLMMIWSLAGCSSAQTAPPCRDVWGNRETAKAIEKAMAEGTESDVVSAINKAKAARKNNIGCAEAAVKYTTPDFTEPKIESLVEIWKEKHSPFIAEYKIGCPAAARNWGFVALGGYYARLAGQNVDLNALQNIAKLYEATQYKAAHAATPLIRPAGLYAYLAAPPGDKCFDKTSINGIPLGEILHKYCEDQTLACVTYNGGLFAGQKFIVADIEPTTKNYDGGGAYDHGIAGVMMIEAVLQLPESADKKLFMESAMLAGDWAISEPPVRNHNYTAKLVWLLAELYSLTGEAKYKAALLDKLDRNLKPGVLMDADQNGIVDGTNDVQFSQLVNVAQRSGRMWDGHNARPVYHAMNAFALVDAYVALRDNGDTAEAEKLKPFMMAMLDNIAWEVNNLGVPNSGRTQIPFALLLGLWKVAAYENKPQPEWEKALRAIWNTGIGTEAGEGTLSAGLYLLYKSGMKYEPLKKRMK